VSWKVNRRAVIAAALVVGVVACGEQTFDLLPPDELLTGGVSPSGGGGWEATGGDATGGDATGGTSTGGTSTGGTSTGGTVTGGAPVGGITTGGTDWTPPGGTDSAVGGREPDEPCGYCAVNEVCVFVDGANVCVPLFTCESDIDCPDPRFAYCADGRCVECRDSAECLDPQRPVCSDERRCIGCQVDDDCAGPAPYCVSRGPVDKWCVACRGDADCLDPYRPACALNLGICAPCWEDSPHCSDPTPRCDKWKLTCVECFDDAHCAAPTPRCNLPAGQCVQCLGPQDCLPGQYCDSSLQCFPPAP